MEEIKLTILDENGDVVEETIADKAKRLLEKAKAKAKPATDYLREHPREALAGAAAILALSKTAKSLFGKSSTEKRQDTVLHQYYDPKTGLHWQLRRPLTNGERIELMRRKRNGEFVEDILDDFGVLK